MTDDMQRKVRYEWDHRTTYAFDNGVILSILERLYPNHKFEKNVYQAYHSVKADVYADYTITTIEQAMSHEPPKFTIPEFSSSKVDVWHIGMGCGKTEHLLNNTRKDKGKRTLIITSRCSLVVDIAGRFREAGLPVAIYSNFKKGEKHRMVQHDTLIVNGESLAYVRGAKPYDFVYIDEWESFTDTWTSHETHKKVGLRGNWEGFMEAWANAGKVVLMDAFITTKTTSFLDAMGDSRRIVGSKAVPHKRDMRFLTFPEGTKDNGMVHEVMARVVDDLKAGKNILMFYPRSAAARKTGLQDIEAVTRAICEEAGIPMSEARVHYGDQDSKIKDTLQNTNTEWPNMRLVVCNSCVTVGVSFTKRHFHKEVIVAPNFLTVRSLVQFSYRARQLIDDQVDVCYLNAYHKPPPDRAVFTSMMEKCTQNKAFGVLEEFAAKEQDMASSEYMSFFATMDGYEISPIPVVEVQECPWIKERISGAQPYEADDHSLRDLASGEHDDLLAEYKKAIYESRATRRQKATMKKFYFASLFPWGEGTDGSFIKNIWENDWEKHVRVIHEYMTPTPRTLFPYAEVLKEERKTELEKVAFGELDHEKITPFTEEERELYGKRLGIKLFLGKRQNTTQMASQLLKRMFGVPLIRYKKTTRKYLFSGDYSEYLQKIIRNLTSF